MDPPFLWIVVGAGLVLVIVSAIVACSRGGGGERVRGDMIERQRRQSGASPPLIPRRLDGVDRSAAAAHVAHPMTIPEIRAAIEAGRKIEAIKLVRQRFGLGLREAKELVERHS